jgi:hypothetical protein
MRLSYLIAINGFTLLVPSVFAGGANLNLLPGSSGPNPYANQYAHPYAGQYVNPYSSPYVNPYANQYVNPYANQYANPYVNPYNRTVPGYGYGVPGAYYGQPQQLGGGIYNISLGGSSLHLWKAPSGYYYPWAGGYNYSQYPIYIYNAGASSPTSSLPPLSTIFSDVNEYLDKAQKDGKIDENEYKHLKLRASDLLRKEKSEAYEGGGALDASQEAQIRADVDGLSAEVARSVRP